MSKDYTVRAVRCDHRASDEEIYEKLQEATAPLARSWAKLESARTIVFKANMSKLLQDIHRFEGRRRELVDEAVLRASLRLLRERTSARIIALDSVFERPEGHYHTALNYAGILEEFGVEFSDGHALPLKNYEVPGGGLMFRRYPLSATIAEADAFVSIAKLKNHVFQGVTLTLKNLFGLPPMAPYGRTRRYYHHLIRLSNVLPDLGRITAPCLGIIDGLTGQSGREWYGEGRVCNVLIAGDHTIATDACGAYLMGFDPQADWPSQPHLRDRSALRIAAESGFGTVNLDEIDFVSEVASPVAQFATTVIDTPETIARWRETTCEQALNYRDHEREFVGRYAGEYLMLQDGEVIWHGPDASDLPSRRLLSGPQKSSAIYLKKVESDDSDPAEREDEHFEVYERELAAMRA